MHPLEELRYVARGWGNEDGFPAQEVAAVLADLAGESPATLVHACRRIIEYFPSSGQAWWLSARALAAGGDVEAIREAASELADDPTGGLLCRALSGAGAGAVAAVHPTPAVSVALHGLGGARLQKKANGADVVVVTARAAGPSAVLATERSAAVARNARSARGPGQAAPAVWVVVERGALLPAQLWEQLLARSGDRVKAGILGPGEVQVGVGDKGRAEPAEVLAGPTCPAVAELLGWRSI